MKGTPGTSTAAQNWSNWFSQGSSCNTSYVSSTWRGANAFKVIGRVMQVDIQHLHQLVQVRIVMVIKVMQFPC